MFSVRAHTRTQYPTIKTSPVQLNGSVGQALALCGNERLKNINFFLVNLRYAVLAVQIVVRRFSKFRF